VASEIEIRDAIVSRIISAVSIFTPTAIVLGRDITGILDSGSVDSLRDSGEAVHVITVTQRSMLPIDIRQGGTLYELVYDIIQWKQLRTGTNISNSDQEASLERDALINAFKWASELPTILSRAHVKPLEWPVGALNKLRPIANGQVWMSSAILRASNFYGPVGCS
jgi:hypothetical protein